MKEITTNALITFLVFAAPVAFIGFYIELSKG